MQDKLQEVPTTQRQNNLSNKIWKWLHGVKYVKCINIQELIMLTFGSKLTSKEKIKHLFFLSCTDYSLQSAREVLHSRGIKANKCRENNKIGKSPFCNISWNNGSNQQTLMSAKSIKWMVGEELYNRARLTSPWTHWSILTSLKLGEAYPDTV